MTRPFLVFGRSGQVARELAEEAQALKVEVVFAGRERLDLSDPAGLDEGVAAVIAETAPSAVINAAALTSVDGAEAEQARARVMNRDAPAAMARACARRGIPIVQLSTDYVFDGLKGSPYVETDATGAVNAYGRSKLEGEQAIAASGARHGILRVSWVFGPHGSNFARRMIELAATRGVLEVVDDLVGRPTSGQDVARAALEVGRRLAAGEQAVEGVLHACGPDDATWADLACAVLLQSRKLGGPWAEVRPIPSSARPTPAKRPPDTRLDIGKARSAFGYDPLPWRDAVATRITRV